MEKITGVDSARVTLVRTGIEGTGPVIYWMSREQRASDNWALLFAQQAALERKKPLVVLFTLAESFLQALPRTFAFMYEGLTETAAALEKKHISFLLVRGDPSRSAARAIHAYAAALVVTETDPLLIKQNWKQSMMAAITCPVYEVDAHSIVPVRVASSKLEYAARTIRPKINRQLSRFLTPFPKLLTHPFSLKKAVAPASFPKSTQASGFTAGTQAALRQLQTFIQKGLAEYNTGKNDPAASKVSRLSPYLHFGQLSAQRVALEIQPFLPIYPAAAESFLEELIVRRELAENFCFYNNRYDSLAAAPPWAQKTLEAHRQDKRPYLYTPETLEAAETHDVIWNSCQQALTDTGYLHGYLRMYWAKKILEWSASPEEALAQAICLNDRYLLDGRDPNGYTGIMWSIAGLHDRPWGERPVFGTIRYMSQAALFRKFDMRRYLTQAQISKASSL